MATDALQAALGPSPSLLTDINNAKSKFRCSLKQKSGGKGKSSKLPLPLSQMEFEETKLFFSVCCSVKFFSVYCSVTMDMTELWLKHVSLPVFSEMQSHIFQCLKHWEKWNGFPISSPLPNMNTVSCSSQGLMRQPAISLSIFISSELNS